MECRSVDEDGIGICRDRRTIITHYAKRPSEEPRMPTTAENGYRPGDRAHRQTRRSSG
jgi:hypothetical protein